MESKVVDQTVDKLARELIDRVSNRSVIEIAEDIEDAILVEAASRGGVEDLEGMSVQQVMANKMLVDSYNATLDDVLKRIKDPATYPMLDLWSALNGSVKQTRSTGLNGIDFVRRLLKIKARRGAVKPRAVIRTVHTDALDKAPAPMAPPSPAAGPEAVKTSPPPTATTATPPIRTDVAATMTTTTTKTPPGTKPPQQLLSPSASVPPTATATAGGIAPAVSPPRPVTGGALPPSASAPPTPLRKSTLLQDTRVRQETIKQDATAVVPLNPQGGSGAPGAVRPSAAPAAAAPAPINDVNKLREEARKRRAEEAARNAASDDEDDLDILMEIDLDT